MNGRLAVAGCCALALAACTGNSSAPTPTTTVSVSSIAQVGGTWSGTSTLTSATGGECVGPTVAATVGSVGTVAVAVQQNGANATATVTDAGTGTTCSYTGTVGASTFVFNATTCQVGRLNGLTCTNSAKRDIVLFADSFVGSVNGTVATGTSAESWNVFVANTTTAVGVLIINSSFNIHR